MVVKVGHYSDGPHVMWSLRWLDEKERAAWRAVCSHGMAFQAGAWWASFEIALKGGGYGKS